jgi:hypothetical protein
MKMMFFSVTPPTKWKAGSTGTPPNDKPIYFSCADCDAKDAEIAGIISSDGTYNGIGLLGEIQKMNLRPAMFCAPCYAKRLAKAGIVESAPEKPAPEPERAWCETVN